MSSMPRDFPSVTQVAEHRAAATAAGSAGCCDFSSCAARFDRYQFAIDTRLDHMKMYWPTYEMLQHLLQSWDRFACVLRALPTANIYLACLLSCELFDWRFATLLGHALQITVMEDHRNAIHR